MAKEKSKTTLPKVMEGELQTHLVKLREDAGFDTSQMADALCLSEEVIINLENEAFDLLAEPPYVRGYLRNYAKLGDEEDASELITKYEALRGADATELDFQIKSNGTISDNESKRLSPIWGQVILLGVLIAGLAFIFSIPAVKTWAVESWQSFSSQMEPSDSSKNPSLLGDLPVPSPLPEELEKNIQESNGTNTPTPSVDEKNTNTTDNVNVQPNTTTEDTGTEAEPTTNENVVAPETATTETESTDSSSSDIQEVTSTSADGSINIRLVFNKEVWLRIKDKENKTVFEGLNKAETEKNINLMKPLTFRVGNAQGLSLFIDDKAVDISTYINGSIANFTLE